MALPALALLGKAAATVGTGVRVVKAAAKSKKTIDALMKAKKAAKTAKEKAVNFIINLIDRFLERSWQRKEDRLTKKQ